MLSSSATVTGSDGRTWHVTQNLEWVAPHDGDDWEHDVGSGIMGKATGLIGIGAFWVGLLGWFPAGQYVPVWVKVAAVVSGLLVVATLPLRWLILRPWVIVAETPGDQDREPERWIGLVRTRATAREEVELIVRSIRATGTPQYESGLLGPVS
jgi:hypothetical protein